MAPPVELQPATGVIHDIGYRRYQGPRLGRSYAIQSLYSHSLRAAFGIGRGAKAKIFPWLIVGIVIAYALIAIAVRSITGQALITYRGFATGMSFPVIMFLAVVAPELVSRDLRDKVLPLYFSRPVRRVDYALTKLAALLSAVMLLLAVPQLLIYVGAIFTRNDGFSGAMNELGDLWPGLASAAIRAIVLAGIALLIASTTGRRAFAAAGTVAVFLVTAPIVGVLYVIGRHTGGSLSELSQLANPMTLLNADMEWLFGIESNQQSTIGHFGWVYGVTTLALVVFCLSLLLVRYRKVSS